MAAEAILNSGIFSIFHGATELEKVLSLILPQDGAPCLMGFQFNKHLRSPHAKCDILAHAFAFESHSKRGAMGHEPHFAYKEAEAR